MVCCITLFIYSNDVFCLFVCWIVVYIAIWQRFVWEFSFLLVYVILLKTCLVWDPTFHDNSIEFVPFLNLPPQINSITVPFRAPIFIFSQSWFLNFGKFLFDYAGGIIPLKTYFGIAITNFLFQLIFTFNLHSRIK